jgi:hypothetical protein
MRKIDLTNFHVATSETARQINPHYLKLHPAPAANVTRRPGETLRASGVRRRSLPASNTRLVTTDPAMQPRLRGAATLVIQQHFGAPAVA